MLILRKVNLLITAAVVLTVFVHCSCTTNGPSNSPAPQDAIDSGVIPQNGLSIGPSGHPPFPVEGVSPVSVIRTASDGEIVVEGSEFIDEEGENEPGPSGPDAYVIVPGFEDDLAWATYGIGGFDGDRPISLQVQINSAGLLPGGDDPLPLSAWVGLSNFTDYAWEWYGPYEEAVTLELNSAALHDRYVSTGNSFYYAIVTDSSSVEPGPGNPTGTSGVEIISSTTAAIDADSPGYTPTAPHYPTTSGSGLGAGKMGLALDPTSQHVTVFWDHLTDSAAEANEATHYDVYRSRQGSAGGMVLLGTVEAPDVDFVDPVDTRPLIGDVIPGETYNYMVVARNSAGKTPFSPAGTHAIPMLAPPNLTATHGTSTDWIELRWERTEGAVRYQIYRDTTATPFASVDDITVWRDLAVPDADEHNYWVRGVNQFNSGGMLSGLVVGRINIPPQAAIGITGESNVPPGTEVIFSGAASTDEFGDIALYEWDADGDGTFEFSSTTDPGYAFKYNTSGDYTARLRVTDADGESDEATIDIHVNSAPTAELIGPPPPVYTGPPFTLNAAGSFDPETDPLLLFEWDLDNDGVVDFNETAEEIGFENQSSAVLTRNPGTYVFRVRVTDADGLTDTAEVTVVVNP